MERNSLTGLVSLGALSAPGPAGSRDDPAGIIRAIDRSIPPVVRIESGETVVLECPGPPLSPDASVADFVAILDLDSPLAMVGPVEVAGAEPGDTLVVEVLAVEVPSGHGHAMLIPGEGLLGDEVGEHYVHNFGWQEGDGDTELRPGVRVPIDPFCGTLGVMPAAPGPHTPLPPRVNGGNMDNRHLVAGAVLMLPVEVPGALFFAGDGHAAQGDGEVSVTGLETAVRARLRLSVERGKPISAPRFLTPAPHGVHVDPRGSFGVSAPGPDLLECAREAVREMVGWLTADHGLSREEALVLCGLAVDLRITEVVDRPNWIVSAHLPLAVFDGG